MVLDLIHNAALLVALAVGLQMLARAFPGQGIHYRIAAGVLFGAVAVVGMMTPVHFAPGIICDGRSIVLSLAGLFGGAATGGVAAVFAGLYRYQLGGPGALPGILVVIEAAALGIALHGLRRRDERWVRPLRLWLFGVVVHVGMLALQLLLPGDLGLSAIQRVGPAVLVLYPLAVLLLGRHLVQLQRGGRDEADLRESQDRFRALVEGAPDAILVQTNGRFVYCNSAALALFGAERPEQLIGHPVLERFDPAMREEMRERIECVTEKKEPLHSAQETYLRFDGTEVPVEVSAVPTVFDGEDGAIVFVRDIRQRLDLEQRYAHAQKMEAIGRLAGGVAHDFNNMLQAILGHADLLLLDARAGEGREELDQIHTAAMRSAQLTRQLLGFARKQTVAPRLLDLNTGIADTLALLERLIGEDIDLRWRPCAGVCPVVLDPSQMDQVLANLVVNARDAIPGVGSITITTDRVELDAEACRIHEGCVPGPFVLLAVHDDGSGMDAETCARAFEPFFTTKGRDLGTGLGLATVFGIARQNNGFVTIDSEPGHGTSVRVYLPREHAGDLEPVATSIRREVPRGSETILFVEDEPALLSLGEQMLTNLGYSVLATGSPRDALRIAREHPGELHALVTDVILPQMNGRDLWRMVQGLRPQARCLFVSGHAQDVLAAGTLESGTHFLQKPFTTFDLACKLREVVE